MNTEKIRELAFRAGFCRSDEGEFSNTMIGTTHEDALKNFAELMIRECVKVCADRGKHHDGLYSAWASDCSERIGKHFGVEE